MQMCTSLIGLISLFLAGCTSLHRELVLTSGYSPPVNARVLLAEVKAEGEAKEKLQQALNQALRDADLAWRLKGRPLLLAVEVLEYTPSAPAWLWGLQSTEFKVRATLQENDRIVGVANLKYKTHRFGTQAGAEDWLFAEVAKRLVQDLRARLYGF